MIIQLYQHLSETTSANKTLMKGGFIAGLMYLPEFVLAAVGVPNKLPNNYDVMHFDYIFTA